MSGAAGRFDALAASWDDEPRRVKLAGDIVAAIERSVPLTAAMDVVDIGCGTGLLSLRLAARARSVVGVDGSKRMLDVLESKAARAGCVNVRTIHLDLEGGQVIPGRYNVAIAGMVLHHVADLPALLASVRAILRPGGWLAVADLDEEGGEFHADPAGVVHDGFDREVFRRLLERSGFTSVRVADAAEIVKAGRSGDIRSFGVFLATGRVPGGV